MINLSRVVECADNFEPTEVQYDEVTVHFVQQTDAIFSLLAQGAGLRYIEWIDDNSSFKSEYVSRHTGEVLNFIITNPLDGNVKVEVYSYKTLIYNLLTDNTTTLLNDFCQTFGGII